MTGVELERIDPRDDCESSGGVADWIGVDMAQTTPAPSLADAVAQYLALCAPVGDCLIRHEGVEHYGEVRTFDGGKRMSAHRAVYTVMHGPIPAGKVIRHKCDLMACVRPEHLEVGTDAQNIRDIYDRHRQHRGHRRGDEHPCAVLTAEIVTEARLLSAEGASLYELTERYQVKYLTLASAIRGRTWKHLDTPPVPGQTRLPNPRALAVANPGLCRDAAALADAGLNLVEIGERLGVSRMTAWRLAKSGREMGQAS